MPIRFQVDGDFYDHPKTIGMSDGATALWVRAGSYSAAKLTDGFVADAALSLLSRCPEEAASELVGCGLWRRVKGGFRFHQWGVRNLTRERVEAERARDRERKRDERGHGSVTLSVTCSQCGHTYVTARSDSKYCSPRCRKAASRVPKPQLETQVVPLDSNPESSGTPPGFRPLSVSVSVSESVSGSGHDPSHPPPDRCPNHAHDPDPPPCGPCRDARLNRDAWTTDELKRELRTTQLHRQQTAHDRAEAARAAISRCRQCDETGYLPGGAVCPHDPAAAQRARRGAAEARTALRRESA